MLEWFVLNVRSQYEARVSKELVQIGVKNYLPQVRVEHRRKSDGRLLANIRPLFPNCLFVQLNWKRMPTLSILTLKGVNGFMCYTDSMNKPHTIRQRDITALRERMRLYGDEISRELSRSKGIYPGMLVNVLFGPFRDQTAIVQSVEGSRVEVLLQLLGKELPKKLPVDCLQAA